MVRQRERWGFFGKDDREALIIGSEFFEFRVTDYTKYGEFKERLKEILSSVCQSVDILGMLDVHEIILTYCDAIIPAYQKPLDAYFNNEHSVLPLDFIRGHREQDQWQAGQVQVTRVVKPNQKISILLEQVPYDPDQGISKWLPSNVIEPDNEFAMPLPIREEWKGQLHDDNYGLLTTQASELFEKTLGTLDLDQAMDPLHELTKVTFNEIINQETCNHDWGYVPN